MATIYIWIKIQTIYAAAATKLKKQRTKFRGKKTRIKTKIKKKVGPVWASLKARLPIIKTWLWKVWSFAWPGLAAALVAAGVMLLFASIFPEIFGRYRANGGPVTALLVGAFIIGLLLGHPMNETVKKVGISTIATIMVAGIFSGLFTSLPDKAGKEKAIASGQQKAATPAIQAACPGLKVPVTFRKTPTTVNLNGQCSVWLWFEKRCIFVQQFQSTAPRKICAGEKLPNDIEKVWSADEPFNGSYALHPPVYTRLIEIRN